MADAGGSGAGAAAPQRFEVRGICVLGRGPPSSPPSSTTRPSASRPARLVHPFAGLACSCIAPSDRSRRGARAPAPPLPLGPPRRSRSGRPSRSGAGTSSWRTAPSAATTSWTSASSARPTRRRRPPRTASWRGAWRAASRRSGARARARAQLHSLLRRACALASRLTPISLSHAARALSAPRAGASATTPFTSTVSAAAAAASARRGACAHASPSSLAACRHLALAEDAAGVPAGQPRLGVRQVRPVRSRGGGGGANACTAIRAHAFAPLSRCLRRAPS